jgi:CheY-like chemotaxis protein/sRNA-binding carbon storage regulator CsrA
MLVLSRKEQQRLVFPHLGISVEVLRIGGSTVRVGVTAPRDVRLLRGELVDEWEPSDCEESASRRRHDFRDRLNGAALALHLLRRHLHSGRFEDAEETLGRALQAFAELDEMAAGGAADDPPEHDSKAPRALVVEDNSNERELLAGYLRLCGYRVDAVEHGRAAMRYLSRNRRPDMMLLDMRMPEMDGPSTVSAIRCDPRYRDMKIFAVSGLEPSALQVPTGRDGVDRWFAKPLKPDEFARELGAELSSGCTAS